jgi:NAD(P)H-dependent flavin oxidoreductase YrpB (nitropropane dioxygenase family)
MTLTTRITELLGIEHPIVQGGMQVVGVPELAAAVSEAGGLGMLTALTFPSATALRDAIERCKAMTGKPFGVNISVFPTMNSPDYPGIVQAIADSGITIVETAGTPAVREVWEMLHARGIIIIHKCTSVRHALSSERHGVHVVSIDGFECAGHPGEDDIPGLVLIPAAANKVKVPLLASGGIADGRGLVAALALGADGINMGTRFCATQEAQIHPNIKRAYLDNDERGTTLLFRKLRNTARVGRNRVAEEVVRILDQPDSTFAEVAELVAGAKGRELLSSGDVEGGIYWASMAQGLIHDLPTCHELIDRIMRDANAIIACRLAGMTADT